MSYWQDRMARATTAIGDKTISDIEKQLKKYYASAMKRTIADFEATYEKLLNTMEDGREPTPADLYNLDKYWQMQGQLRDEMQKLGDKEVALLSKEFEREWTDVYNSIALPSSGNFSATSIGNAKSMINNVWLPDGKNFSKRIWENTERLTETLNENLIHCIITGKKPTELKQMLQERFNVSYRRADTLVRTETTHIQTQAAAQRFKDYGAKYYEVLVDTDERTCDKCSELEGKKFLFTEMQPGKNAPPMHPNDRCAIIPVLDNEREEIMNKEFDERTAKYINPRPQYPDDGRLVAVRVEGDYLRGKNYYLMEDAHGNRKEVTRDEMNRINKISREYSLKVGKSTSLTEEQQKTFDLFKRYFDSDKDVISEAFDSKTERYLRSVSRCPNCGYLFDKSASPHTEKCPKCGFNNTSDGYKLHFEHRYIYEDENGNEQVLTSISHGKKEDEKRKIAQQEEERRIEKEAIRQQLVKQQRRVDAQKRVAENDEGISSDKAYSTAPFKRTLEEAETTEGKFTYYRYHCTECNRWFDTTVKNKKKCPVCGENMEYSHGTKIEINNKKCAECGKIFNASTDNNRVLCDDCEKQILFSRDAEKLKKHGYTDRGAINVLTGKRDPYNREQKSSFDMYWQYAKKHPEQKEEIEAISITDRDKHFFTCIDCGEIVFTENIKNNAQKRCPECQAKYRKWYKALKEKERRAKKKNN